MNHEWTRINTNKSGLTAGLLTQISYPGSVAPQLSYGYDLRGNLESVSGGGFSVAYERRLDDRIDGMTFSNGVDNSRTYDADGRLTETNYRRGSAAPFSKAAYALNSLGQRTSVERANGYGDTFAYDGNGNVTELTGGSGGTVASYRYTAFGDTWSKSGSAADANHYRFSTKPLDAETISASSAAFQDGLYYYGFRYYDPQTGRWPSRDPIEERGGLNIYAFVGNNPIQHTDRLGLATYPSVDNAFEEEADEKCDCEYDIVQRDCGGFKFIAEDFRAGYQFWRRYDYTATQTCAWCKSGGFAVCKTSSINEESTSITDTTDSEEISYPHPSTGPSYDSLSLSERNYFTWSEFAEQLNGSSGGVSVLGFHLAPPNMYCNPNM